MKKLSVGEETMAQHLRAEKIPFQREVKLIPGRKSKVDFLLPHNVILEVEGGTRSFGRHSRHNGFQEDCRKYNKPPSAIRCTASPPKWWPPAKH
jgi:hypothetical protein